MNAQNSGGFTLIEFFIVVVLAALAITLAMNSGSRVVAHSGTTKQLNNVKQITLTCLHYAADHGGTFPNGSHDPQLRKETGKRSAMTAEACFNDLFETKKADVEKIFWSPRHFTQCSPDPPDENGALTGSENCWDYVSGLTSKSDKNLPLTFEASDAGNAKTWSATSGHPWEKHLVIGYVDGSAERLDLTIDKEAVVDRDGTEVHLCLPTPGINGWPETAKLAPATPLTKSSP